MNRLTVELTPEECEEFSAIVITFIRDRGCVRIAEGWDDPDEVYGNGVLVTIPNRVWEIGLKWLSENP